MLGQVARNWSSGGFRGWFKGLFIGGLPILTASSGMSCQGV